MNDLENALGQFIFYRAILKEKEPERELFLAVPDEIFKTIFEKEFHDLLKKNDLVKVFGVNEEKEEIPLRIVGSRYNSGCSFPQYKN